MADIAIVWDAARARGDWRIADGDLQAGSDLETAVLLSLFTDRRADPDFVVWDGSGDRRGWWADTYNGYQLGSTLWQYKRAKKAASTNLPLAVQAACLDALLWMKSSGVAASIACRTGWIDRTTIGIAITVTKPNGDTGSFTYAWAWENV